jgi:TolA-binding protein
MKKLLLLPVILFCISCSSESGKLLQEALKLESANKTPQALKMFEKIVSDSPSSKEAPEALYHCAALYRTVKNDPLKAASTYESIAERYPKSEYAHKGLFAAGFMFANEMNNFAKAKTLYEKYLSMFPDSSMAKDAKFELKNLGKSPEEILQALQDTTAKQKEPVAGK